jgi:predicted naringenin-chalcone synthase
MSDLPPGAPNGRLSRFRTNEKCPPASAQSMAATIASMPQQHSKPTLLSMAIIAAGLAALLHEGLGHGVLAWLRGDIPIQLTSNHLSALHVDRWVDAAGTLVNLAVGALALLAAQAAGSRANLRYFCWILAAQNLLPGAGYFLYSGILGFGDWEEVIRGLPHQAA